VKERTYQTLEVGLPPAWLRQERVPAETGTEIVPLEARPAAAEATSAPTRALPLLITSSVAASESVRVHSTRVSVPAGTGWPRVVPLAVMVPPMR